MTLHKPVTLLLFVLLGTVAVASAQLRYVDSQGVVHWVQTPEQIPPEYREKPARPKLPDIDAVKGENPAARARRKAVETEAAENDVRAGMGTLLRKG